MGDASGNRGGITLTEEDLREMISRLAHTLRNPLATIRSGLQLVQHLLKPQDEVAEYLESMLTETAHIDGAIRGMQQFVNLRLLPGEPLPLQDAVAEVVELVRPEGRRRGVSFEVAPPRDARVLADAAQFRLALQQVVENAIRHSPRDATVRLSWDRQSEGLLAVHVDDTGPGVPAENADKILRPFFSTARTGIGLGLNVAGRVGRLAGGRLEWSNRPGGGCRFSLVLPEA